MTEHIKVCPCPHGIPVCKKGCEECGHVVVNSEHPTEGYYFGCWHGAGHYLHDLRGSSRRVNYEQIPWGTSIDGTLTPVGTTKQSKAALWHKSGWTALSMHDYSVDTRGNSNAAFLFHAVLDAEQVLALARQYWPTIVTRIEAAAPIEVIQ